MNARLKSLMVLHASMLGHVDLRGLAYTGAHLDTLADD